MPTPILMPALSPTMEKGNLAKWLVKEGDNVTAGDVIAEIETDKATMEVEAVDEGTMGKILIAAGTSDVAVNAPIALLLAEGESADALENTAAAPIEVPSAASASPASSSAAGQPPAPAQEAAAPPAPSPATNGHSPNLIFASPLAKRLARQHGFDLATMKGSGPHGRIILRDIEQRFSAPVAAPPAATEQRAPAVQSKAPAPKPAPAPVMAENAKELPHDGMRKIIAERLTQSKQTIPHFYLNIVCELDALLALRADLNKAAPKDQDGKPTYKLSVNDFLIKAMALALKKEPMANASWTDTARVLHAHSDVGVAVAIDDGLFTPIIARAEEKSLSHISNEMKDLAARARKKRLAPHEYQGGSTAISNLGMFGIDSFSAVINPPQATILAVGAGKQQAVVKGGEVVIANCMACCLSCDHRVVDGALAAKLLAAFKQYVENPMSMLV